MLPWFGRRRIDESASEKIGHALPPLHIIRRVPAATLPTTAKDIIPCGLPCARRSTRLAVSPSSQRLALPSKGISREAGADLRPSQRRHFPSIPSNEPRQLVRLCDDASSGLTGLGAPHSAAHSPRSHEGRQPWPANMAFTNSRTRLSCRDITLATLCRLSTGDRTANAMRTNTSVSHAPFATCAPRRLAARARTEPVPPLQASISAFPGNAAATTGTAMSTPTAAPPAAAPWG